MEFKCIIHIKKNIVCTVCVHAFKKKKEEESYHMF